MSDFADELADGIRTENYLSRNPDQKERIDKISFREISINPNLIKNGSDIDYLIRSSHSISLPPSIISAIDSGINSGHLKPDKAHSIVCDSIDSIKNGGYAWKSDVASDVKAVFVKDPSVSTVKNGDIFIKENSDKNRFDAFKIEYGKGRFLGSEPSLDSLKIRVEQFTACSTVKDRINEAITISKNASKVQEKSASYGLEL
jgi:hypothetical protein